MLRPADLVLRNGRILTVDARFSIAEAVAIEHDRFVAVGSNRDITARIGAQTTVIDLAGRTAMPGLIDGHAHMDREGLKGIFPSLGTVRSIADIQRRIAELARAARPGEWIVTMPIGDAPAYFDVPDILREKRFPTRQELDEAAPDNPVYIRSIWGYWRHLPPLVSIANTRALRMAGITRNTAPPAPNVRIEKDAAGEPTGVFVEDTLMPIVELTLMRCAPGFTRESRARTLPEAMRAYHAFGTTSVFEEHGAASELIRAYKDVHAAGRMTMRTGLVVSPDWRLGSGVPFDTLIERWYGWLAEPHPGDDWLRLTGLMVDIEVLPENAVRRTALPYTGWAGFNYDTAVPRAQAKELLIACARNEVRVVGIWPNMLDLYDEVNRVVPIRDQRWVLGHLSALSPDDIGRIRDLGLVMSSHTNRYVYKEGHLLQQKLGAARENEISPLRALAEAGVTVSLATDNVPVSLFWPVWQAVSRMNRYTGQRVAPEQALTREQALRGATLNGAHLTLEEHSKGSIEPGKLADVAVLSDDPIACAEEAIRDIAAELTIVGGKVVWERS